MDIEEFLDRELSDLGLPITKNEKHEESIELPQYEEDIKSSPLFDSIRLNIAKGSLDQAEKSYIQLWHVLLQQRLKWNRELYGQLSALSRQLSSALQAAQNEVKRKAEHVYGLISSGRSSLKEGKKEAPLKIYAEIEGTINSIPDAFFEEKKIVEGQAMDFYKELTSATDNELVKRVSQLIQDAYRLVDNSSAAIRSGDMINAVVNYNKCIGLYNQIPEGFLKHKNSIGMRILEIYKSLSIYTEISLLQNQLARGIEQFQSSRQQQPMLQRSNPAKPIGMQANSNFREASASQKNMLLHSRKERAKKSMEKGFYNEASKEIEEALKLEPNDAEAIAMHAKLNAMQ